MEIDLSVLRISMHMHDRHLPSPPSFLRDPEATAWHDAVRASASQELPRKVVEGRLIFLSISAAAGRPEEMEALESILEAIIMVRS